MRTLVILVALLIFSHHALAKTATALQLPDGSIIERRTYSFPTYEKAEQVANIKEYATKAAYEAAVNDGDFEFQKLKYSSDGLKVVAYLYKPVRLTSKKLPAIVFNRGDVVRGDIAPQLVWLFHQLATEGFVVLAPMYRQSDGGEGRDEVGGADVDDLLNVVPLARSLGFVDMNNLFLLGESRGGMMTYQAIRRAFPANAAAVYGAFTDLDGLIKSRPEVYQPKLLTQIWPDFDARRDEIAKARSAIYWPEALKIPLLIMHGGADWSVDPAQSLNLAQKLQELRKSYELIVYAGDGHRLTQNEADRNRRTVAWFRSHIKSTP